MLRCRACTPYLKWLVCVWKAWASKQVMDKGLLKIRFKCCNLLSGGFNKRIPLFSSKESQLQCQGCSFGLSLLEHKIQDYCVILLANQVWHMHYLMLLWLMEFIKEHNEKKKVFILRDIYLPKWLLQLSSCYVLDFQCATHFPRS